ncbi:MAG: MFS transporter [Oscillospiraceae bacterium]|nr:MFS transporter [Oscillospiraceae bacterium]
MNDSSKAKRAAIGACIALFANMGMNSTFTIFLPSFMATWPEAGVATIALAATFGCAMAFIWSTFLVGPMLKKTAPRTLFFVCAILSVGYCLIHYFSSAVWMLIVAGLLGGSTLGLGTHAMGVAAVSPYFASYGKKTPTVIAVVLASAALGAAAFSFIPGALIPSMGWRNVYLVMGVVIVICNLVAVALIPKIEIPKTSGEVAAAAAAASPAEEVPGLTLSQALKTGAFWLVFIGILFLTIMYQGLCTYMVTYLTTCGMSQSVASSMQGIMQLFGIVFILLGGALVNKIGIKGLIIFTGVPLAVGCLLYAYVFPGSVTVLMAIICSVLCVTGGVITNICPTITPILFGNKNLNQINPIFSGGAFWGGAALSSQVVGRVITGTGSFANGFTVAAVIGVVGMVALFLALAASPMKKLGK